MTPEKLLAEGEWLRRIAHALVGDANADDLAQDAWEAALRHPPAAEGRPVRPWLRRVARNLAAMSARGAGRRQRREGMAAAAAAEVPTPERLVARLELSRLLATLVLALDEPYRQAVVLRYYEGLSAVDIGRRLRVPPGTVRWRLKEALDRLRMRLDEAHGGDRRAWCAVLAPLARGALVVKKIAVVAGVLLVVAAGLVSMRAMREPAAGPPVLVVTAKTGPAVQLNVPTGPDPRPGAIEGMVRRPDGRPAGGARVMVSGDDRSAGGVTAPDGFYRIPALRAGTYVVGASAHGFAPGFRENVVLLGNETLTGVDVTLASGGVMLSGRVVDTGAGGIATAMITLLDSRSRGLAASSDVDGRYTVQITEGEWEAVAAANGYAPEHARLKVTSNHLHDFRLHPAAQIAGLVIERRSRRPVSGATILVEPDGLWARHRSAETDHAGRFHLRSLEPGGYRVIARREMVVGQLGRRLVVNAAQNVMDLLIEVDRGRVVSGHVRTAAGPFRPPPPSGEALPGARGGPRSSPPPAVRPT